MAQKVRVEEELEAYPTESVDLRCQFIDGGGRTKLTQVSWIWEPTDGQRDNIAVYHPIYGQSFPNLSFRDRVVFLHNSLENPSIRISNLRMSDAGRYTCEYATYPSGNEQGTTTLIMLAKPKNSAKVVTVQAGTKSVVVAQCEAAEGKPAATIKWLASVGGNHSTSTTNGPDGTVTVRSEYRLVPTPTDNGREVTCMVDQRTQERPWVYPVKLSVEYPPSVSTRGIRQQLVRRPFRCHPPLPGQRQPCTHHHHLDRLLARDTGQIFGPALSPAGRKLQDKASSKRLPVRLTLLETGVYMRPFV
ncbi:nectin-2-like protein [Lates japonicus]|uniref:Nectin cell adhesion molecule 3 n=1 Tax=Lates japonicus TaxID=270547 RepID=A0AAD3MQF5_LATJO|nr:nectin-2-like protein [Lates japonicus]